MGSRPSCKSITLFMTDMPGSVALLSTSICQCAAGELSASLTALLASAFAAS